MAHTAQDASAEQWLAMAQAAGLRPLRIRGKTLLPIDQANPVALDREICKARAAAQGQGWIAVNVMKAPSAYKAYVRQSLRSGVADLVRYLLTPAPPVLPSPA